LPDLSTTQLERGRAAGRHSESARASTRVSGPARQPTAEGFRFVGLPEKLELPTHWLHERVSSEIIGARAVNLGPEPLIGSQRIVVRIDERSIAVTTDGLAPFAVESRAAP
jgi:general secretion pathway protein H